MFPIGGARTTTIQKAERRSDLIFTVLTSQYNSFNMDTPRCKPHYCCVSPLADIFHSGFMWSVRDSSQKYTGKGVGGGCSFDLAAFAACMSVFLEINPAIGRTYPHHYRPRCLIRAGWNRSRRTRPAPLSFSHFFMQRFQRSIHMRLRSPSATQTAPSYTRKNTRYSATILGTAPRERLALFLPSCPKGNNTSLDMTVHL